jgi:tartrate dehydrogenase/decarboxylase/D-malate dehydrogenase
MFEPVHGSAPDIAGQGKANPLGQVWAASMMLDHLGHEDAGKDLISAMEHVLTETDVRTPDLGGTATTDEVSDALVSAFESLTSTGVGK